MGEVLSQNEIDSLLAALSTGEMDMEEMKDKGERQAKNYDFQRPAKFSKEHLRTLEFIFEQYGRLVATNLTVYLRKSIQVNVLNSETVTFSEFANALVSPALLGIVDLEPLSGKVMMDISTNLGFAIIDRMLGGEGVPLEKNRELSEIERAIVEKVMVTCVQLLREPWKNVVDLSPYLERIETNPQFAQIIAPSDMVAIVTLSIKIGDVEGMMNFCLPFFTLEDVMDKLNTKYWYSSMKEYGEGNYEESIESVLRKTRIPVHAVLGHSSVSVSDFLNLQVGDIIKLDSKVDTDMEVYVGNIKKFMALPGASGDGYAVRVTSVIREEE